MAELTLKSELIGSRESCDDAALHRALAGCAATHGRAMFAAAQGILRDSAAAEDLCQHAMMRAWQERDRLRDVSRLGAWLMAVVTNDALMLRRRRATETKILSNHAHQHAPNAAPESPLELRESILSALDELPEMTRLVVVMRVMENCAGTEVSQLLGISPSEVSRRLHDGITRLAAPLAPWNDSTANTR